MVRGVIFDIDGTLLLSNEAHAHAWVDAFQEFGYDIPFEKIFPLIGMGGDKLLATLVPGLSDTSGTGKGLSERRKEIFLSRYAPKLRPAPGSRDLVMKVRDDGLRVGIATSAKSQELETLLKAAQVDGLIKHQTTSDDAEESKPDPDIVQAALQKLKLQSGDVVMIGDTPYDVESAGKAGIKVIAVRCGGHTDGELQGALAIFDDPADILTHFEETPLKGRLETSAAQ